MSTTQPDHHFHLRPSDAGYSLLHQILLEETREIYEAIVRLNGRRQFIPELQDVFIAAQKAIDAP